MAAEPMQCDTASLQALNTSFEHFSNMCSLQSLRKCLKAVIALIDGEWAGRVHHVST